MALIRAARHAAIAVMALTASMHAAAQELANSIQGPLAPPQQFDSSGAN